MTECIFCDFENAEGILDKDIADEYCRTHTVILRKKGFFRTLSDLWNKNTGISNDREIILVVRIKDK